MSKKLKRAIGFEGMPFGEALERLFGVDPKEIQLEIEKAKKEAGEIDIEISKIEDSIDRGARRSTHRFRL